MKKAIALFLTMALCAGVLAGCNSSNAPGGKRITLRVVTSFGGDDGNRNNYEEAFKAWESKTGNTIQDESATADETWKAQILADFETGSEADVVFYFNGVDSNPFIEAGKVVSIDEIRTEYPDYATNMIDGKMGASPFDNKNYSVPTTGYWEGMYVNKTVLKAAGAEMPGPKTTWAEFLDICQKVKDAGYTPIATSLANIPHYWFEFSVMNNGNPNTHETVPAAIGDSAFKAWAGGLSDIKELYDKGFLPEDTLSATDDETFQMMATEEAAFAVDGSWKMNWFIDNASDLADYGVTYVPGKGERKATDIIGGLSMGYYITRKAWDDPAKRTAVVDFVTSMTTDEVINKMASGTAVTALAAGTKSPAETNPLLDSALAMINSATSVTPAVQDKISADQRKILLPDNTPRVVKGEMTPAESIEEALGLK